MSTGVSSSLKRFYTGDATDKRSLASLLFVSETRSVFGFKTNLKKGTFFESITPDNLLDPFDIIPSRKIHVPEEGYSSSFYGNTNMGKGFFTGIDKGIGVTISLGIQDSTYKEYRDSINKDTNYIPDILRYSPKENKAEDVFSCGSECSWYDVLRTSSKNSKKRSYKNSNNILEIVRPNLKSKAEDVFSCGAECSWDNIGRTSFERFFVDEEQRHPDVKTNVFSILHENFFNIAKTRDSNENKNIENFIRPTMLFGLNTWKYFRAKEINAILIQNKEKKTKTDKTDK